MYRVEHWDGLNMWQMCWVCPSLFANGMPTAGIHCFLHILWLQLSVTLAYANMCIFWVVFVIVVTFKYLNPASPAFFHACNGKFVWIWLWQTCTEKLQLWGSTTHLYQKSKFHPRKLWSYDDLSANTRIYSFNQQSQISADLPFTITQYITQFYKICSW